MYLSTMDALIEEILARYTPGFILDEPILKDVQVHLLILSGLGIHATA